CSGASARVAVDAASAAASARRVKKKRRSCVGGATGRVGTHLGELPRGIDMRNATAQRLAQILLTTRGIGADDLAAAGGIGGAERLAVRLVRLGTATEEQIAEAVATELRLPLVRIVRGAIPADALQRVPEALAERYTVLPLEVTGNVLCLAMADPLDL